MKGSRVWHRFEIQQLEDLANAVLGAEFEVIQMAGARVRGSLAFCVCDGITFSSGLIRGNVAVSGAVSRDSITIGTCLRAGAGSRQGLKAIRDGDVTIFLPGDELDGLLTKGTLYICATLSAKRLEEEAARERHAIETTFGKQSCLHVMPIAPRSLARLQSCVAEIHSNRITDKERSSDAGLLMLRTVLAHRVPSPESGDEPRSPLGREQIVSRAREYIRANLAKPISMEVLASASRTSQRSLARAFGEVLQDTPCSYVRRLRLHRIRDDLAATDSLAQPVSDISYKWGIREPGRMAGWYRDLFGELPTETRARMRFKNQVRNLLL